MSALAAARANCSERMRIEAHNGAQRDAALSGGLDSPPRDSSSDTFLLFTMAKRINPQVPPPEPPELRIPCSEAAVKIQKQIDEGEQLLSQPVRSGSELEALRDSRRIWSDYNNTLLRQMFTTSAIADEYSAFYGAVFRVNPDIKERIDQWRDDVRTSLTRLRSIRGRLELFATPGAGATVELGQPHRGSGIFVVHGTNNEAKESVARFLERLGLKAIILHEQPDRGRTVIEKFEDNATVGFAVVILTADDVGAPCISPTDLHARARQNVLVELGYFLGKLGRSRVCALREEGVEIPSDLAGVLYVPFDAAGAWRLRLASEIKAAGIEVDLNRAM